MTGRVRVEEITMHFDGPPELKEMVEAEAPRFIAARLGEAINDFDEWHKKVDGSLAKMLVDVPGADTDFKIRCRTVLKDLCWELWKRNIAEMAMLDMKIDIAKELATRHDKLKDKVTVLEADNAQMRWTIDRVLSN